MGLPSISNIRAGYSSADVKVPIQRCCSHSRGESNDVRTPFLSIGGFRSQLIDDRYTFRMQHLDGLLDNTSAYVSSFLVASLNHTHLQSFLPRRTYRA